MAVGGKRITEIGDPRLVKALAHPLRVQVLQALEDREASPSELAAEFDCPLPNLSYHFRMLVQLGLLRETRTRQRRGAIEHYYRTKPGISIADSAWGKLPTPVKSGVVAHTIEQLGLDALEAVTNGGFEGGQIARHAVALDVEGWEAVQKALAAADDAIKAAVAESNKRTNGNGAEGTVAMLMFAKPKPKLTIPRERVMVTIAALRKDGERATLSSITRRLFPKHAGHAVGKAQPPGRDVQITLDALLDEGTIRQTGTYKRGSVYEPTQ